MNVLISCGGTGGHIYPGIAIAEKIKNENKDANILFVGTKKGMENRLVPAAGFEIKGIDAKGFDRKNLLNNFKTIYETLAGSHEMKALLDEFKPNIVIGCGGYVTGPVLLQAHRHGIPCYIHEQNAVPGVANKLISRFADKVFVSFKGTEKYFAHPSRVFLTGNPVRNEFSNLDRKKCREENNLKEKDKMILIFSGSLGAQVVNEEALQLIENIKKDNKDYKVVFVTGDRYYDEIKSKIEKDNVPLDFVTLLNYAYDMPKLMCAADLVVSRAGAIAVSEIAACGKPSILIPSPNVTANHQFYNAKALADENAAVLLEEKELIEESKDLSVEVFRILEDDNLRNEMSKAAFSLGNMNAVDEIYNKLDI